MGWVVKNAPLARLHRVVANRGELLCNRGHVSRDTSKPAHLVLCVVQRQRVVASVDVNRVAPRQEAAAGGAAKAVRVKAVQNHARGRKGIYVWRHHFFGVGLIGSVVANLRTGGELG